MSKLLNDPNRAVADLLRGLDAMHAGVTVDHEARVVYRRVPASAGKVALISGGGSGHEPLHSGFVGTGMLDAACIGEVFSSPTPNQIVAAIERCDRGGGTLLIVKNFMGDQLNFEIAAERANAAGYDVRTATIDDDVASGGHRSAGRRGVGLTVIAEKILGSAAESGATIDELVELADGLRRAGRSMGLGLSSCTHPVAGSPTFSIGDDEIEIGIGIHGEPGLRRDVLAPAAVLAETLVNAILSDLAPPDGSSFIALVNGTGGTPLIELYVMAGEVERIVAERGHRVDRYLVGSYITSLEMAGCSVTLLLTDSSINHHWDAPVATVALTWGRAA